jgi:hypothetical protein
MAILPGIEILVAGSEPTGPLFVNHKIDGQIRWAIQVLI